MSEESQREKIYASVRGALKGIQEKVALPDYDDAVCVSGIYLQKETLWENFCANFAAVSGRAMRSIDELAAFLREYDYGFGFCDPGLKEAVGEPLEKKGLEVAYAFERERHNEYTFGITRASGAIAESGTVVLNDFDTVDRLAALAPWVHVAVLEEDLMVRTIPEGIARFGDCPNIVWVTGPSKTGDIEGILIEGVHGPGEQVCLCL